MAQLHEAIRGSPARKFWPVIRETKGVLLIRSTDTGQECPSPWRRTNRCRITTKSRLNNKVSPKQQSSYFFKNSSMAFYDLFRVQLRLDAEPVLKLRQEKSGGSC